MTYPINFKNITNKVDFYPELPAVYKKADPQGNGTNNGLSRTFRN